MTYDSLTEMANTHYSDKTFTAEYDDDRTDEAIITPTTGKSLKITGVYISTEGATTIGQKIRLEFSTTGDTVATFFPTKVADTGSTMNLDGIVVRGAQNEVLDVTSDLGLGKNYFIAIKYREE